MHATASTPTASQRYAKTIEVSKRIRWDIDRDIVRGRAFDLAQKFLPDSLSLSTSSASSTPHSSASSARSRVAPTPTCSVWSSASSAPRCSR